MAQARGNPHAARDAKRSRVMGPPNARLSVEERFEMKVDRSGECHRWTGAHNDKGYGNFWYERRARPAHVVAVLMAGVEIPDGMTVDHVWARGCKHTDCVRIEHLEVVSMRENILRSNNPAALNARKKQCNKGHDLVPRSSGPGWRTCKTCTAEYRKLVIEREAADPALREARLAYFREYNKRRWAEQRGAA